MTVSNKHLQACMETWLNCENLLIALLQKGTSFSKRTIQTLDECANICLGTMNALKAQHQSINEIALLCVGICEECAEVCERYTEKSFQTCASICRQCSALISPFAKAAI